MDEYEKCLVKDKYSFDQSICIKKIVQDTMKKKNVKKRLLEEIVVLSKTPAFMDDPNEVAHLNFDEMVMGFYPDNIRDGNDLKEAINHEISHLIANDNAMPRFHSEMENKNISADLVEKKRPGHNKEWETIKNSE